MDAQNRSERVCGRRAGLVAALLAAGVILATPTGATAADRTVLLENFGGTWCMYCPGADGAISRILDDGDLRFVPIRWHYGDSYQIPTGVTRNNQYAITGYPTSLFDAVYRVVGGSTDPYDNGVYNSYRFYINLRMGVSTPVTIDLDCEDLGGNVYQANATVSLEPGNPDEDVEIWFCVVEDHYPNIPPYWYYRYTARKAPADGQYRTISASAPTTVGWRFDADPSWDPNECIVVAWVEEANPTGIGDVRQAAQTPMLAPPILGDFDGDGDVDLDDFGSFAACFNGSARPPAGTCPPGVDADFDGDGDVDLDDFSILAANYTGVQ